MDLAPGTVEGTILFTTACHRKKDLLHVVTRGNVACHSKGAATCHCHRDWRLSLVKDIATPLLP